jgi:hypothetical protein
MNDKYTNICLKFDDFVSDYKKDKLEKSKRTEQYIKKIKESLSNSVIVDKKLIDDYNMCVSIDAIFKDIDNALGDKNTNKYMEYKRDAIKDGRTLQYYCKYPKDVEFINLIEDILRETKV